LFPTRLTKIDDLTRPDHWYLETDDTCYYLGEYTARRGYAFSDTNQLIFNLKKPPDRKGRPEWRHKERAIQIAGRALRANFKDEALAGTATLVPIPPSKAKGDLMYDDRILRVVQEICRGLDADIRELVCQHESTNPVHGSEVRLTPEQLAENYYIDEAVANPAPRLIFVFDDVLTTGSHFKGVKRVLQERYLGVEVLGFFIARRVPDTTDIEDLLS
jgi:hypothetical protein